MEMWMRAHSVSCPPLFSDEVAQFMFALYRLCLPHVISVTSNSLRSLRPFNTLHCTRAESTRTAQERLSVRQRSAGPFFLKLHRIPTLLMIRLLGGTSVALLGSSLSLPVTAAQMCVLSCMAVNYLIN